eukprot:scaffold109653_cov78-Phaeocystis_antarctica.AAC.3
MVPTPMRPPGTANCRSFDSAKSERMREKSGTHFIAPSLPREMMPAGSGAMGGEQWWAVGVPQQHSAGAPRRASVAGCAGLQRGGEGGQCFSSPRCNLRIGRTFPH